MKRELAYQIAEQFNTIGNGIKVKVLVCTGGSSEITQTLKLADKPHIVVATPGRLKIMLRNSENMDCMKNIRYLILDEADMLLEEGEMVESMIEIIKYFPPKDRIQTIALSATMSDILSSFIDTESNLKAFFWKEETE